ncbi:MAG TPA: cytochrome d ubiquinol oxidase subunit II [Candidatus Tidjanibacter gallistercoris]|nr:cytochrome d ubiquinol oxidase subunit II [Candidatus Tidjanibacter gallistercoris]
MITYSFLQHYWWFLISLLGGLLAFLLFVQGGQSMLFSLPGNDDQKKVMLSVLGRKWEYTFTTLVTFGGALFASFPLFYSTSFGGAYWLWMLLLLSFVVQAVSYEFRSRPGNVFGTKTYDIFLFINGLLGTLLVGVVVGTFFTGSDFTVDRDNIAAVGSPVISRWGNAWHGLEAIANPRNLCLGIAVLFLARTLALLLFINRAADDTFRARCRKVLWYNAVPFVVFFLVFVVWTMLGSGYAVAPTGEVSLQPYKYFMNMLQMPAVGILFVLGVLGVLYGIIVSLACAGVRHGIWVSGIGTVVTVTCLLLCAGYNGTAFYPSSADLQSSLTIFNASSSFFTLKVMSVVSLLIPFVLAYIFYAWRALEKKRAAPEDAENDGHP